MALAGKGGTGKTTVAALFIRYLTQQRLGMVLPLTLTMRGWALVDDIFAA